MKKTINQLRVEFQDIATAHDQINYFFWGDLVRSWNEDEVSYPRMCAYYPSGQMLTNQTEIQFVIDIADKLYEDIGINLNDIESDTLQICRDIFQVINQSARWQKLGRVESCSVTKFIETTADSIAGHSMTFTFRLRDNSGICNLPMTDYDFDEVVNAGCAGVTYEITDSDGGILYSGSVDSGGSLNQGISDSTAVLKDTDGNVLSSTSILAQGSEDIEAPDAAFANSDNSYTGNILSGGSLNIPDININVNGSNEGQVPAVKDINVNLEDSSGPVTPDAISLVGDTLTLTLPDAVDNGGITSPILVTGDSSDGALGRDFWEFPIVSSVQINNTFGNKWRFTGHTGGYYDRDTSQYKDVSGTVTTKALAFPDGLFIDHFTKDWNGNLVMYYRGDSVTTPLGIESLTHAFAKANPPASVAGFSGGWTMANINQLTRLQYQGKMQEEPFLPGHGSAYIQSSTDAIGAANLSATWCLQSNIWLSGSDILDKSHAAAANILTMYTRITNISEL